VELTKEALKLLKKEVFKEGDYASKLCLLREALRDRHQDAILFIIMGWDTFEASFDPESSAWYVHGAYFSKDRSLEQMKRLQPKADNLIADQYCLVQGTMQELMEGRPEGRKSSPLETESILEKLLLEIQEIS
jgi:hypothetical protein